MQSRPRIRIRYSGPRSSVPATGWLGKAVAAAVTAVAVVVALVFSVVLLAALLAVGLIAGGYIWWRTRALRRQLREQMAAAQARAAAAQPQPQGDIIEGEFTRTSEAADERQG
jgi:Flp pilus assembly protein TadB